MEFGSVVKNCNQKIRASTSDTLNFLYTIQGVTGIQDTLHFENATYMVIHERINTTTLSRST